MKYNYIIFHKGCLDGFSSFIVLYKTHTIDKNAKIYPDTPSTNIIPDDIKNKDVIIMDVAYKYNVLSEIVKLAKSVLYIDHHITSYEDNKKITSQNFKMIFNKYESGASLTWKHFFPKIKLPLFIQYVKDNDIGIWKMKHTHDFIASVNVNYPKELSHNNIDKWLQLFHNTTIKKVINKGIIYNEYVEYVMNANYNKFSSGYFPSNKLYNMFPDAFNKPKQYKVAIYTGHGCPNNTLLALKILDKTSADFVMFWTLNFERQEYIVSFRSRDVNVGKIAKLFNGGGHDLAASCNIPKTLFSIDQLVETK
jgi:hypothetical protein